MAGGGRHERVIGGGQVSRRFLSFGVLLAVLAWQCAPAWARSPFDGRWLVVIRSASAHCAPGGYAVSIRNGVVSYPGFGPVSIRGRVDRQGRIAVHLNSGDAWAQAAGRLSARSGAGTWRGRLRQRACTGRWRAMRR